MKIGKWPIYQFFIDHDGKYFPLQCMLDLESTSFIRSLKATNAFAIPVVKRTEQVNSVDVTRRDIETEELFMIPLELSFGNHRSYDEDNHAFEEMKTSGHHDTLIPAWYVEKHQAPGTMTTHLHFRHCPLECY